MRIVVDVNGFYDWAPAPPGTQITQEDVSALRAKQMSDDKWHMRVPIKLEEGKTTNHDVGIHEESICKRMAALEKLGRTESREQVVAEMLTSSFRHHLAPSHMIKINVHDDGPNKDMFCEALTEVGITDQADPLARYMDQADLEAYLNMFFKTKSVKKTGGK